MQKTASSPPKTTQPDKSRPIRKAERVALASRRWRRNLRPRRPDGYSNEIYGPGDPEDPDYSGPPVPSTKVATPRADAAIDVLIRKINLNGLDAARLLRGAIELSRTAGLALADAQKIVGQRGFDPWVTVTLPFSPAEARALIAFAEDATVRAADVSPTRSVPLAKTARLVGVLCDGLKRRSG